MAARIKIVTVFQADFIGKKHRDLFLGKYYSAVIQIGSSWLVHNPG